MGVANELDSWMTWIDNSMADAAYDVPVTDDFDNFVGGQHTMHSLVGACPDVGCVDEMLG